MKRTLALALSLASGLALNAAAQTPSPAAAPAPVAATPAKVAVIAFAAAVAQTNEGQRTLGDVQRKFQPKRDQLKALSDEIDNLKKQLQAQGDKLSAAESASRTKTIDDKTKQLQRSAEDAQNDYNQEMGEAMNSLETKVYETVETYAKEQGFTLVLDGSQQQTPILWFAETTNITPQIIAAYNAKSGVPAPPPQSATPAAPKPAAPKPTTPAAPKK